MKKLIALLIIVSNSAFAQDSLSKKTIDIPTQEFCIGLTNLLNKQNIIVNYPYILNGQVVGTYQAPIIENPNGVGLGYKLNFSNRHAIRMLFGLQYSKRTYTSGNNPTFQSPAPPVTLDSENEILFQEYSIRFGYQNRFKLSGNFFSYFGIEAIMLRSKYSNTFNVTNTFTDPLTGEINTTVTNNNSFIENQALGGAPFFGVQYFISHRLSLSLESKIDVLQTQSEVNNLATTVQNIANQNSYSETLTEIKAIPLGFFSINAHF